MKPSRAVNWIVGIALSGVLGGVIAHKMDLTFEKRMDLVRLSYASGCFHSALMVCGVVEDDILRGKCHDRALDNCEKMALGFENWLRDGK